MLYYPRGDDFLPRLRPLDSMPIPVPIVLDTDIGTDIDDAYALVLAAASPELDLCAVTTVNNDTTVRARIAAGLLRLMGRHAVPVYAGESGSLTQGETRGWMGHEGRGMGLASLEDAAILPDAPTALASLARSARQVGHPITLITIGAMTNVAVAFRRFAEDMSHLSGVVAMASDFAAYGDENARPEHNVACDPVAVQQVLSSGVPVTLVGLNVTQQTMMTRSDLEELESVGGPLAEALVGMHRIWFDAIRGDRSPMHDGLAVAAALRPDLVTLADVHARVLLDREPAGSIAFNRPAGAEVTRHRVATGVDAQSFRHLLRERVMQAAARSRDAAFYSG